MCPWFVAGIGSQDVPLIKGAHHIFVLSRAGHSKGACHGLQLNVIVLQLFVPLKYSPCVQPATLAHLVVVIQIICQKGLAPWTKK